MHRPKPLTCSIQNLGMGLGLRSHYYPEFLSPKPNQCQSIEWLEIVTENFIHTSGNPFRVLKAMSERLPIIPHGVGLSIGSAQPIDQDYMGSLKKLVDVLKPPFVSDHLCWSRLHRDPLHASRPESSSMIVNEKRQFNSYDLLPLAYNRQNLSFVAEKIDRIQSALAVPLALENPTCYLVHKGNAMPEAEFLNELHERTGCLVLLDINNIFVNEQNLGVPASTFIETINPKAVVQYHIAGHWESQDIIIDTHDSDIRSEVWKLYKHALKKIGPRSTLLEWDDKFPDLAHLKEILHQAQTIQNEINLPESEALYQSTHLVETTINKLSRGKDLTPDLEIPHLLLEAQNQWVEAINQALYDGLGNESEEKKARHAESLSPLIEQQWTSGNRSFSRSFRVYCDNHAYALLDSMRSSFPGTCSLLGEDLWPAICQHYLASLSSHPLSLDNIGFEFPQFLLSHINTESFYELSQVQRQFLADLSDLEWQMQWLFLNGGRDHPVPLAELGSALRDNLAEIRFSMPRSFAVVPTHYEMPLLLHLEGKPLTWQDLTDAESGLRQTNLHEPAKTGLLLSYADKINYEQLGPIQMSILQYMCQFTRSSLFDLCGHFDGVYSADELMQQVFTFYERGLLGHIILP